MGTVYRHFPTLDELVPACGAISMQVVALPDPVLGPAEPCLGFFECRLVTGDRVVHRAGAVTE